jgi:hypothetical protein
MAYLLVRQIRKEPVMGRPIKVLTITDQEK